MNDRVVFEPSFSPYPILELFKKKYRSIVRIIQRIGRNIFVVLRVKSLFFIQNC